MSDRDPGGGSYGAGPVAVVVGLGGTPPPVEPAIPPAPAAPMGGTPPPLANGGAPPCCDEMPAAPPAARAPPAPPIGGDPRSGAPALPPVAVTWPPADGERLSNCTEGASSAHPTSTASGSTVNSLHRMGRSITLSDGCAHHLAHPIALISFASCASSQATHSVGLARSRKHDERDRYV